MAGGADDVDEANGKEEEEGKGKAGVVANEAVLVLWQVVAVIMVLWCGGAWWWLWWWLWCGG
jgi:hypothetical protein